MQGHTDEVLSLALSEGARYLASGGKDRRVGVWDVEKGEWVKGFGGHRDTISVCILSRRTFLILIDCSPLYFEKAANNFTPRRMTERSSSSTWASWDMSRHSLDTKTVY